mmetsp:Transcript_92953/g.225715  ORF Transcript_92953/g.225715 Transcript_92953/m.225715 type:complete len:583 (-) Transcript_92953:71-1819(-)
MARFAARARLLAAVAAVTLAILAHGTLGTIPDSSDTSQFRVDLPAPLRGSYVHSEALFGLPSYGGSVSGRLVYGTPGMNKTGCHAITPDPSWPDEPILMVDRGDCSFTTKVRNSEMAGAMAVVIADNYGMCELGVCADVPCDCSAPRLDCECRMPYMADDGSGGDINIPSFLLTRYHTDLFKECILGEGAAGTLCAAPTPVVVSMEWSLPRTDGIVYFDFWTTAEESRAAEFRHEISYLVEPLGTSVRFTPHFFIYDGEKWGCTRTYNDGFACGNQCTNSGRYCSPDPDDGFDTGHSGADVVMENLRQMCIWQQANSTYEIDYGKRWWDYTALFDEHCTSADVEWDECSNEQQYAAGLDAGITNECVNAAGGVDERGPENSLLEAEVRLRDDLVIVTLPTVVVNEVIERGATTTQNVLATLCAGFVQGSEPLLCKYCQSVEAEALENCLKRAEGMDGSGSNGNDDDGGGSHGGPNGQQSGGGSTVGPPTNSGGADTGLIIVVVILVLVVGVGGFIGYKQLKAMRTKLDSFEYRALAGDASEASAAPKADAVGQQWGAVPAAGGDAVEGADVELRAGATSTDA